MKYTAEQAAKVLRQMAEATANMSQNWDNYEAICLDMIKAALGKELPKDVGV